MAPSSPFVRPRPAVARRPADTAQIQSYLQVLLCLFAMGAAGAAQQAAHSAAHQDLPYVISVNVNIVVLHASVVDHRGLPISGLGRQNFQIFEQGVLQQVKHFSNDDIPVTVGLVIDNSGSMKAKRADVIAAALAFARSSNARDQMFVVNFNEKVSFALPVSIPFTDSVAQLEVALASVNANGQTALYDAVDLALAHLAKAERDKKVLIIISDGGDNASKHTLEAVLSAAKHSEVIIYTVGLFDAVDEDRNPGVLKRFAEETGGEAFLPDAVQEVVPVCERIARDIRSQYTLTYSPANSVDDGKYRTVEVRAGGPGHKRLLVRTRTGYFAPTAPLPEDSVGHERR